MATKIGILFFAFVFVAYESSLVEGICPQTQVEAETASKNCLRNIGLDIDSTSSGGSMMGNDVDKVKQYCSDGTLQNALTCVENIMNDCRNQNSQLAKALDKAISIDKLRTGFKYICNNVDVLVDNSECISNNQGAVASCVQVEAKRFQTELQAKQNSGQMNEDDVWGLSCSFMDRVFVCQHDIYESNCSKELAEVMTTFLDSAKPPICAQYSSAVFFNPSWLLLTALLTISLYLIQH